MVYKRYITDKNGKKRGPYYYKNIRENGKVKSVYLGTKNPEDKNVFNYKPMFVVALFLIGVFGIVFLNLVYTGYSVHESNSSSTDEWIMFGRTLNNTRLYPDNINLANFGLLWTSPATSGSMVYTSASILEGVLYYGDTGGYIRAINLSTGESRWNFSLNSTITYSSSAIANNTLFIGTGSTNEEGSKQLFALNITNGTRLWNRSLGNAVGSPVVYNNTVYVMTQNKVFAYSLYGDHLWNRSGNGSDIIPYPPSLAVYNNTLVVSLKESTNHFLQALNATDGTLFWNSHLRGRTSNPAIYEDVVYVGGGLNSSWAMVTAVWFTNGTQRWNYTFDQTCSMVRSSPAVSNDRVFVGVTCPQALDDFYAFNATNGSVIWSKNLGTNLVPSPTVTNNGIVFMGSDDNKVYAFDVTNGDELWMYTTPNLITYSSPTIVDGRLYIGCENGNMYAFAQNDTIAPQVNLLTPLDNQSYFTSEATRTLTFTYNVSDGGNDIANCSLILDGAVFSTNSTIVKSQSSLSFDVAIPYGDHTWNINCTDYGNNEGTNSSRSLNLLLVSENNSISDWLMFRGTLNHTGYYPGTVNLNNFGLLWNYPTFDDLSTPASSHAIYSSPVVYNNTVFFSAQHQSPPIHNHYSLNATNGSKVWNYSYNILGSIGEPSSPAITNHLLYVGSSIGNLTSIWVNNGTPKWKGIEGVILSSPAIYNNTLFIGEGTNLSAFNASDGTLLWTRYSNNSNNYATPAVRDGIVYMGGSNGTGNLGVFYALWTNNGTIKWSKKLNGTYTSSPTLVNDLLYIGTLTKQVYALNTTDGDIVWNYTTGDVIYSSPAFFKGVTYIGSNDNNLYAFNATNGTLVWNYSTGGDVYSSPTITENGILFVGGADNKFYAFNATNGEKLWEYTTENLISYSSPAIANGRIYIGCVNGDMYAFAASADTDYPIVTLSIPTAGQTFSVGSQNISITFTYSVSDVSNDIANCSLIIDGVVNLTNSTIVKSQSSLFFNQTFAISTTHTWDVNCTDYGNNEGNSSGPRSFSINAITSPGGPSSSSSPSTPVTPVTPVVVPEPKPEVKPESVIEPAPPVTTQILSSAGNSRSQMRSCLKEADFSPEEAEYIVDVLGLDLCAFKRGNVDIAVEERCGGIEIVLDSNTRVFSSMLDSVPEFLVDFSAKQISEECPWCNNGVKDYDEEGIDCGESCKACDVVEEVIYEFDYKEVLPWWLLILAFGFLVVLFYFRNYSRIHFKSFTVVGILIAFGLFLMNGSGKITGAAIGLVDTLNNIYIFVLFWFIVFGFLGFWIYKKITRVRPSLMSVESLLKDCMDLLKKEEYGHAREVFDLADSRYHDLRKSNEEVDNLYNEIEFYLEVYDLCNRIKLKEKVKEKEFDKLIAKASKIKVSSKDVYADMKSKFDSALRSFKR